MSAAGLWECRRHVHVVAEACSACPPWRAKAFGVGDLGWHRVLPRRGSAAVSPESFRGGYNKKGTGCSGSCRTSPSES